MKTMANRSIVPLLPFAAAVIAAGCVSNPPAADSAAGPQLAPMAQPAFSAGSTLNFTDEIGGDTVTWTVDQVEDGYASMHDQSGCSWVSSDIMGPSQSWQDCGEGAWGSGRATSLSLKGGLWPLEVGNKVTFTQLFVNGEGQRAPRHSKRSCRVAGTETIAVGEQSLDTFKVVCQQNYGDRLERSYWLSPEHGYVKTQRGSGTNVKERLVRQL